MKLRERKGIPNERVHGPIAALAPLPRPPPLPSFLFSFFYGAAPTLPARGGRGASPSSVVLLDANQKHQGETDAKAEALL